MAAALRLHTRETVESALILGFRSLRSCPCWTVGPRLLEGHAPPAALALNWLPDFVLKQDDRVRLMLWLRCRAKGESWDDLCRQAGWKRDTEDKRRQRIVAAIVAGLNAGLTIPKPASEP